MHTTKFLSARNPNLVQNIVNKLLLLDAAWSVKVATGGNSMPLSWAPSSLPEIELHDPNSHHKHPTSHSGKTITQSPQSTHYPSLTAQPHRNPLSDTLGPNSRTQSSNFKPSRRPSPITPWFPWTPQMESESYRAMEVASTHGSMNKSSSWWASARTQSKWISMQMVLGFHGHGRIMELLHSWVQALSFEFDSREFSQEKIKAFWRESEMWNLRNLLRRETKLRRIKKLKKLKNK